MKVVHIITRLIIGGAQENTLHNVEDQHQLFDDDVTLITGLPEGPEGSLLPRAERGGFRLIVAPELVRSIKPRTDWKAYRRLLAELRDLKPDVVHTHASKAGILGRAAAARLHIPVVHTIHGASFHYGQSPLAYHAYILAEKWAARRTTRFISVADAMTEAYVSAGIAEPERFVTIRSGFEVEPYLRADEFRESTRHELGYAADEFVIGKVARLFHLKGHEFVIRAANEVLAHCPQARFLFVGDGILREQFQAEILRAGLQHAFQFTGLVPPERIPMLMGAMDAVVHTSQWEGLARVLPQGLLAGKPVVTYDVGGAREVVVNDETGYVIARDAVPELSAALIKLIEHPERSRQMGELGRQRCCQPFDHRYMTDQIRKVYAQCLTQKHEP